MSSNIDMGSIAVEKGLFRSFEDRVEQRARTHEIASSRNTLEDGLMVIQSLRPAPSTWQIVLMSLRPDRIVIPNPLKREARRPQCGTLSRRIHFRPPWDWPWSRWPVQLCIVTRRFFCDPPFCQQIIFSLSFLEILESSAHQTVRLQKALLEMANTGTAEGASRAAWVMGCFTSEDSLLRQRREPIIIPEPKIIGVDEFALRRGTTCGTLIVDLVRHRPIAVLNTEQAEPFRVWLKAHPGIEITVRDRDESFTGAARSAAPRAIQVADRFHLIKNAGDAPKKVIQSRHWRLPTETAGESVILESTFTVMKAAAPTRGK